MNVWETQGYCMKHVVVWWEELRKERGGLQEEGLFINLAVFVSCPDVFLPQF